MNAVIITFAVLTCLLLPPPGRAETCQLDVVRSSASKSLMGGWRAAQRDNGQVVNLMKTAVDAAKTSSYGSTPLHSEHRVIEAFSQLVNGVNYCIRFSAAGNCGDYHCKSYECTAKGFQPRQSTEITLGGVECNETQACNLEAVRTASSQSLLGGWRPESTEDERIVNLQQTASAIARVNASSITDAYTQTVRGSNYCIRFIAKATGNCGNHCKELTCVAGGHEPLPLEDGSVLGVTDIGVQCDHAEPNLLQSISHSSAFKHLPAVTMVILCTAAAAIFDFA